MLGEVLKQARIERGLTMQEAAELLEVSRQAVYLWETGRNYPRLWKFPKIVEVYGVDPYERLKEENYNEKKEENE